MLLVSRYVTGFSFSYIYDVWVGEASVSKNQMGRRLGAGVCVGEKLY